MPPPFNPSKSGPGGARGLVRRTETWYAPDELAWAPTPPFGITTATVAQQAADWPEQPQTWGYPRWYAPEPSFEAFVPPATPFDPAPYDWQDQPADWRPQQWFQPDTEQWSPIPGLTVAPVEAHPTQQPDASEQRDNRARWVQPDTHEAWTAVPGLTVAPVEQHPIQQPDASEQLSTAQRWFAPPEYSGPELPPTRLYPRVSLNYAAGDPSRNPQGFTPASGTWDVNTGNSWRWMLPTRPANTTSNAVSETTTAVNQNAYLRTLVSPPLDGPQRIEGWLRAMFTAEEALATNDARAQLLVRVVSNDGQTVRGTVLAFDNGALTNEFPIAPDETRKFPVGWTNSILTPLDAQDGDRIIVEYGFRAAVSGALANVTFGQHPTDDHGPEEGETDLTVNTWVQFSKAYKFRGEPDTSSWTIEQPGQERSWAWNTWFSPDASVEGLTPPGFVAFDPSIYDWQEQPASWTAQVWHAPEETDDVPTTLATAYSGFDLEEQPGQERELRQRWFAPEAAVEGLTPPVAIFDRQEQPQHWRVEFWFQRDVTESYVPTPYLTVAPTEQQPTQVDGLDEQLDRSQQWFTTDDAFEGLVPPGFVPPFNPATDQPLPEQPAEWRPIVWFAPDASVEGDIPRPSAVFDPGAGYPWQEQPAEWRLETRFQPDTETWTAIPNLTVAAVAQQPIGQPDISEQRANGQRWYQPEDAWESPLPFPFVGVPADKLAELWQDGSGQQDRSLQPTWHAPDADYEVVTPPPIDATPFGGIWQEQPGQERELVIRWFTPDDDYLGRVPQFITTATVAQQAGLWIEQPGQERSLAVRWFAPEAEVNPAGAYLLGIAPSTVPEVLFDVETGDAYLHLDGPFIIKAS